MVANPILGVVCPTEWRGAWYRRVNGMNDIITLTKPVVSHRFALSLTARTRLSNYYSGANMSITHIVTTCPYLYRPHRGPLPCNGSGTAAPLVARDEVNRLDINAGQSQEVSSGVDGLAVSPTPTSSRRMRNTTAAVRGYCFEGSPRTPGDLCAVNTSVRMEWN